MMATLAALLLARAKDLSRHLASAIEGHGRGVHQGRVASRRLRESLPVAGRAAPGAGTARARKALRQVTRALGPVRELDVALGHLEEGLAGAAISRVAVARVRAHVEAERERRRARMLGRLERVDVAGALGRVEQIAGAAGGRALSPRGIVALQQRVRARAVALAMAIDGSGTMYDPDRLHAVRIAGKKLRYALEVAAAAGLADAAADLRLLKRVQGRLGLMHDYQILLEHVAAVSDATPKGRPGAAGLRALARAYDQECRKLHAMYLKRAPALAEMAARLRKLDLKVRKTRSARERRGA